MLERPPVMIVHGQPYAWTSVFPFPEDSAEERVAQSLWYHQNLQTGESSVGVVDLLPLTAANVRRPPVLVVLGRRPADLEWRLRHRKRRRNHK